MCSIRSTRTSCTARHDAQRQGGLAGGWAGRPTWRCGRVHGSGRRCRSACGGRRFTGRSALARAHAWCCRGTMRRALPGVWQRERGLKMARASSPCRHRDHAPLLCDGCHRHRRCHHAATNQHRAVLANAHACADTWWPHTSVRYRLARGTRPRRPSCNHSCSCPARRHTPGCAGHCKVAGGCQRLARRCGPSALPFQPVLWPPRARHRGCRRHAATAGGGLGCGGAGSLFGVQARRAHAGVHGTAPCCCGLSRQPAHRTDPKAAQPRST